MEEFQKKLHSVLRATIIVIIYYITRKFHIFDIRLKINIKTKTVSYYFTLRLK